MATTSSQLLFSQQTDETIRDVLRRLKINLAATGISREVNDADIQTGQAARVRDILFNGLPVNLPRKILDDDWVIRYNAAITSGNQEKAMKILVDKEDATIIKWSKTHDSLTLFWDQPINSSNVSYCKIWYKTSPDSNVYDSAGLSLQANTNSVYSPLIVDVGDINNQLGMYSLTLYGYLANVDYYFKIEHIDLQDNVIDTTTTYKQKVNLVDVAYYRIHYKSNINAAEYNGTGLAIDLNGNALNSPINVSINTSDSRVVINGNNMSLRLYGNMGTSIYKFAVQAVYRDNSLGDIFPIETPIVVSWTRPNILDIQKYSIDYQISNFNSLFLLDLNGNILSNPLEVDMAELSNVNAPNITVYTDMKNAVYRFDVYAIDINGNRNFVQTISLTEASKPERNEYCEIDQQDTGVFNDYDRVSALLWYLNYMFFLENKNWWAAFQIIEERKRRNTIFPKTSPWYFPPKLRGAWEKQPESDQYITYYEQEVKIPILGESNNTKQIVGYIRIHQNLIDQYVLMDISGVSTNRKITLTTAKFTEEYNNINTIIDLSQKMSNSSVGVIEIIDRYKTYPVVNIPFQTYKRNEFQITKTQELIFTFAYYGNTDAVSKLDAFTMDLGSERRIRLEKWETEAKQWFDPGNPEYSVCDTLMATWLQILESKPFGILVDVSRILRAKLVGEPGASKALTSVGASAILENLPLARDGEIPESSMHRIVDIIKEDDAITPAFQQYIEQIYEYIAAIPLYAKDDRTEDKPMNQVLDRKKKVFAGNKDNTQIDVLRLPGFWDLQKISLLKFNHASYWKDLADFNDIANPLDSVEIFEGRLIAVPRLAEDRITPMENKYG